MDDMYRIFNYNVFHSFDVRYSHDFDDGKFDWPWMMIVNVTTNKCPFVDKEFLQPNEACIVFQYMYSDDMWIYRYNDENALFDASKHKDRYCFPMHLNLNTREMYCHNNPIIYSLFPSFKIKSPQSQPNPYVLMCDEFGNLYLNSRMVTSRDELVEFSNKHPSIAMYRQVYCIKQFSKVHKRDLFIPQYIIMIERSTISNPKC